MKANPELTSILENMKQKSLWQIFIFFNMLTLKILFSWFKISSEMRKNHLKRLDCIFLHSVASLHTWLYLLRELHTDSSSEVHHNPHLGSNVLAQTAASENAVSLQMVAVQRSWVSQSSFRSRVTETSPSGQGACLISCFYIISTLPLPEELAVLMKTALPPGTQHRPLVSVPLHTCFQIASLPKRNAYSLPVTPMW